MSVHQIKIPESQKAVIKNNGISSIEILDPTGKQDKIVLKPGEEKSLINHSVINVSQSGIGFGKKQEVITEGYIIPFGIGSVTIEFRDYDD